MKKLFGKKHKDDEAASDSSLGRNSRTPQNDNPYAQQNADSYANNSYLNAQQPYQQRSNSPSSFRTAQSGSGSPAAGRTGLPSGPRLGAPPRQQSQNSYGSASELPQYTGTPKSGSGYSDEKLGSSAGYGANRYDSGPSAYNNQSNNRYASQRPGGYGGFDQSAQDSTPSVPPPQYSAAGPGSGWDAPGSQRFQDPYADQGDMTEEQLEDAQVQDLKRQAAEVRQQTKGLVGNARMQAIQAVESGKASIQMLTEQQERMDRIERGADLAIAKAREGGEGTSKLDRLNSTPFFVPVARRKHLLKEEEMQVRREREDKEAKEETRRTQYEREKKIRQAMGGNDKPKLLGAGKADKYTFEDDDGTEAADEEEINTGIEELSGLVGQMQFQAHTIEALLDADPDQPKRIIEKDVKADELLARANAKIRRIEQS